MADTPPLPPPKSQQFRALTRKAWSFQKRQMFTNCCCICLCPLMMVIISSALGAVINSLIAKSATIENILYCGNNASLNDFGFPILNVSDPRVYGANLSDGKSVNFMTFSTSTLGSGLFGTKYVCSNWFGEQYPHNSEIYERNSNLSGLSKLDSTFVPPPDGGWLGVFRNMNAIDLDVQTTLSKFSQYQTHQWLISSAASGRFKHLGARPRLLPLSVAQASVFGAGTANGSYESWTLNPDPNEYFGLLGTLETRLFVNLSQHDLSGITFERVPYAQLLSNLTSDDDLDDSLSDLLATLIKELSNLNKTAITAKDVSLGDLQAFYASAAQHTQIMPYGALWLNEFDTAKLNVSAILHFGADSRIAASGNFPSQGFRQLLIVSQMGQASLRGLLSAKYGSATITQGVRLFPQEQSTKISIQAGGLIGRILYPFGVSFLLPIFTIMLVKEKEDRIYIMMKLNGLKTWTYYLSHYAVFYILYALSTLVFIIVGLKSRLTFFTQTEIGVLVLLFFIWGHVQIVLAFFFSTLFSKSRIALVLVFLIVLLGVIISLVAERLFSNTTAPPAFFIWPPFAFYRALTLINTASYTTTSMPYKMSKLKYGDEVFKAIQFMIAEVFIYGLISIYLSFVTPSEFGKQYAWHFPVTLPIAFLQKQKRKKLNNGIDPLSESQLALAMEIDVAETQFEDVDVKAEKAKIEKAEYPKGSPLVISHMRKVYPSRRGLGPKFAVKDVSFAAEVGQVFGLLGPNGAGKTTLISILTGIYNPSYGHGIMAGYDIHSSSADICKVMGICPQFDILWDDLTVEEHLYFYARLKGATALNEHIYVQQALANVSLTSLKDRLSKRLSGGEKRRLSIAIALIGTPKVVFLDEPTTGLDPEVRRLIWNIVQHAKEGKAIILTTHSMEEAEALCQRIGIMAKGTLRCIGNSLRLKQLYGTGFRLFFNANAVDMARACRWVESLLPTNHRKIDAYSTMTSYEFTSSDGTISSVFDQMESGKATNGILDWGISQTTLEDVFVKIISEDDANAD